MRVLVVEDDRDLRSGIVQALRESDYAVDEAGDGEEGLYKAEVWDYDAVVLDVMLPGMDGLQLLRRLRSRKDTPVLMLTARDTVSDRVAGLDGGADDYLVKPFDLLELLARLRALTRRVAGKAESVLTVGPVTVDTASRTITVDGSPADLTGREYRLAELLVMNHGRLVTRDMIYDHLFDERHDSMSNLVDVYMSRVRQRLGKDLIRTRRGEGYIFDAPSTD